MFIIVFHHFSSFDHRHFLIIFPHAIIMSNITFFFFFFCGATFSTCFTKFGPQQLPPPTGSGRHRRDISVVLDGWWVRGAASARRQGPRAAQAHPQPHCTRRQVGVRGGSRQMRAARQLRATQANAQPKLTAPLAAAMPERRRPCAVPTNVATWRLHCQSGHRPRPRRQPSGSAGRAQARGTSGAACIGRLPQGPCRVLFNCAQGPTLWS